MNTAQKGFDGSDDLKIGERFLLHFDAPDLPPVPQLGRLQDFRNDGSLCIDTPAEVNPPRGTPVTISSLQRSPVAYRYSSEILGRGRLNGRLPVLLLKAPQRLAREQRRHAHRISAVLQARIEWSCARGQRENLSAPAVITDLSGGGAQLYVKQPVEATVVSVSLSVPTPFVEEWALRKLARCSLRERLGDPLQQTCSAIRARFDHIQARVVRTRTRRGREQLYSLSLSFAEPQEGCYRLVRYLERQAAQKGLTAVTQDVASAA